MVEVIITVTGQAGKEDKSKKFSSVPIAIFREQIAPSAANVPCKDGGLHYYTCASSRVHLSHPPTLPWHARPGKNRMVPVKGSMDILRHCEDLGLATTEWSAEVQADVDWAFK